MSSAVMLKVVLFIAILSIIMLNVIMLSAVTLRFTAPSARANTTKIFYKCTLQFYECNSRPSLVTYANTLMPQYKTIQLNAKSLQVYTCKSLYRISDKCNLKIMASAISVKIIIRDY